VKSIIIIVCMILGTIGVAFVGSWLMQEDKSKPPEFSPAKPDRDGKPPGKH
jgi:flagellar basal body-associated protein FliL